MSKRKIMVVSGNPPADMVSIWSNSPLFEPTFVTSDEEGIELAAQQVFDAVVIDGTDDTINNRKLFAVLPILQPDIALVDYTGEDGTELQSRLTAVFRQKRAQRIRRFLVLDSLIKANTDSLPLFSAN
jgi:hypothetical protein